MLKRGFFIIETLLSLLLFSLTISLFFEYLSKIESIKSNAKQIYAMTNLASKSLELKKPLQEQNLESKLDIIPIPNSKLQKIIVTVNSANNKFTSNKFTLWTIA